MKKILFFISLSLFLFSCKSDEEKAKEQYIKDSITIAVMDRMADNMIERNFNNDEIKKAPVKIISCKYIQDSTSTSKHIEIFYKNVSNKNIVAVRFKWYGLNIYGEPADAGGMDGFGGGSSEQHVKPNEEVGVTWDIYSRNGNTIKGCRPEVVIFEDGTKWSLKNIN